MAPVVPNLFDYTDYKQWTHDSLKALPKGGRGVFSRFAEVANTHKATVSQIFSGDRHLTPEQAVRIAEFWKLSIPETEYFLLLVNFASAGSATLREIYQKQIEREQVRRRELANRLETKHQFTSEQRALFYSNWMYTAIRVLSSIDSTSTLPEISARLKIPQATLEDAVQFLLQSGLCKKENGRIRPGPQSTYIESTSPLVARHHGNWRVKAMERHPFLKKETELSYTGVVSLSAADVKQVREILARTIQKVDEVVAPSDCERAFCFNVDWFEIW